MNANPTSDLGDNPPLAAQSGHSSSQTPHALQNRSHSTQCEILLERMGESYFETNLAGKLTLFNDYVCQFHGRSPDELRQLDFRALMSGEDARRVRAIFQDVFKSGIPSQRFAYDIIRKDGTLASAEAAVALLHGPTGEPVGFSGIARDITEKKKFEKELRQSEEKHRHIIETLEEGYSETDLKGNFTFVNPSACRRLGYSRDELIGANSRAYYPPETTNLSDTVYREVFRTGLPRRIHGHTMFAKDGSCRISDASVSLIRDESGTPTGFRTLTIDRTQQKETEKALHESKRKHTSILANMEECYYELDLAGSFTFANAATCKNLGRSHSEVIGMNYRDYMSEKTILKTRQVFNTVFLTGQPTKIFECEIIDKGGRMHIHEMSVSLMRNTASEPIGFFGISRDRTELMQMEMALRDSEESYRTVMDMSPDTITINRIEDGRYVEVNRAFCDLTGYRSEEVAGRTPTEVNLFVAPNDRKRLAAALRHGVVRGLEMRFRDKSGTISDSLVSARPIQFKGNPCYLFIVTLITPLKMVQQALAESEESYRTILESAPYAIVITRISDAQFRQVNSAFCRQTGFSRAETIGRTTFDLEKLIDSSDRKRMLEILHRDGQVNGLEVCFKAKDGGLLETLFSAAPIRYKGDDCILSMTVDIGARKLAERELDQYRQHLEEMVQSRTVELKAAQQELIKGEKLSVLGQLTATVSHELRNPLGVIRSSNFYLQRHMGDKDDKVPKHFKRIDEQVTLCDAIVSELLEYTRGRNVSRVRDDIRPLLKQVIEQSCEDNTIPIGLEQSGDFSTVPHDPEKMRRVFINVIDNAIQAIKAQQRLAKEAARRYDPAISIQATMQSDHVIIAILDNGVGMNAETLEKAFEPLFTTRARGTGIGLANVKKIISEHGGEVSLESRLGEGTRMIIRLPCT